MEISVALGVENWIPASLLLPLGGSEGESDEAAGFAAGSGAGTTRRQGTAERGTARCGATSLVWRPQAPCGGCGPSSMDAGEGLEQGRTPRPWGLEGRPSTMRSSPQEEGKSEAC